MPKISDSTDNEFSELFNKVLDELYSVNLRFRSPNRRRKSLQEIRQPRPDINTRSPGFKGGSD